MEQDNKQVQQNEAEYYRTMAETHKETLKCFWKDFLKTGVFILAVIIVIIIAGIAWFVANNRVAGDTSSISAQQDIVRIASKGVRQTAEESNLNLFPGTPYVYDNVTYYYTEGGEIAMHLSEDYIISPGASGSIEFYIIPTRDGATTVNLYLGLAGYADKLSEGGTSKAERVEDATLDALLSGHILLFKKYENGHYSEWLYNEGTDGILNNKITIQLTEDSKKGVPYPYTIYWIWPKRYENMANDLFVNGSEEFTGKFLPFIENQANTKIPITQNYFYNRIFLSNAGSLDTFDVRTKAYNLADEYIGTNADYLYLTIRTATFEEQNGDKGRSGQ